MLIDDLFQKVLIDPAKIKGVNRLQIVSGYATANMAEHHMKNLDDCKLKIEIELIVGMASRSGIEKAQHFAFQKLVNHGAYGQSFNCSYVVSGSQVHAKTYCWLIDDQPVMTFAGSANYSLTAFGKSQIEAVATINEQSGQILYKEIFKKSENCLKTNIKIIEPVTKTNQFVDGHDSIILSLLVTRTNDTPSRSGINWGQRKNRDKNEAYINIPAIIGRSGFFPERFLPFTVLTDDGKSFLMVRAQAGGKGIETPFNNALLGEYLRHRMGLPSGIYVTKQHLDTYGRTDVTFLKIDEETYYLDFSLNFAF